MDKTTNRECKECKKNGHDSTGDHLFLAKDGYSWVCVKKEYHNSNSIYIENKKESVVDTMKINKLSTVSSLPSKGNTDRGTSLEASRFFGVKTECSESSGSPVALYYPMYSSGSLVAYKKRTLPKKFSVLSTDSMKGVDVQFFGQNVCPTSSKKLLITGGEEDAIAAFDMLKNKYPTFTPSVVSLPNGENLNSISVNTIFLDNFDEILVCTDMDSAGRKACEDICKKIGDRCLVVSLSEKDASDMKTKGKEDEFINSFFRAKKYTPAELVKLSDIKDGILSEVTRGLSYPWESLSNLSYGLFKKQIIGIAGAVGGGKTVFTNQIISHLIYEHKEKVGLYSFEDTPVGCAKRLITFISGERVDLPDHPVDKKKVEDVLREINNYVTIYDCQGYLEWGVIKGSIRYLAASGTHFFVIDPLTALSSPLSSSKANELLNEMMADLAKMVLSLDITVFLVSHLNNGAGKPHSEGGRVTVDQFTNSRALVRWAHLVIGLERNTQAGDEEEKNTTTVRLLKNRLAGTLGTFKLKYDTQTGRLTEKTYEF